MGWAPEEQADSACVLQRTVKVMKEEARKNSVSQVAELYLQLHQGPLLGP